MKTKDLLNSIENLKVRSAWNKGVKEYTTYLIDECISNYEYEEITSLQELKGVCLNGASDWNQYSYGGFALVYDQDIAERLCNPSELKRCKGGLNEPNKRETWCDVQARALFQAWEMIKRVYNEMNK